VASTDPALPVGAEVITCCYDLGMNTAGGFGQYVRVPAEWVVPLPAGMTLFQSMVLGSAGFTAALCLQRLNEAGLTPDLGEVLVTGATGGVGTLAVALLAQTGYRCAAATGKPEQAELLRSLGASAVLPRSEVQDLSGRPLLKGRWAAVIDTVGGDILSTAIRSTQPNGWVATCGNAGSAELSLTVYPFILRGISLLGIDAATYPLAARTRLWQRMAGPWALTGLERITRVVGLDDLSPEIDRILRGAQVGHVVVDLWN
jgi:acrylyl-CoA reductase (NADPH)